jgi:5'-phosphate synthase pdxT subunit
MALIGVLALQGAFSEHMEVLRKLNIQSFPVKTIKDFQQSFDGLIIPGGESTTIMMLAERSGILDELKRLVKSGFPIWGVCGIL